MKIFNAFGKNLGPILTNAIFMAGQDMGTSALDIWNIKNGAGIETKMPSTHSEMSGHYTALTVFISVEKLANSLGLKLSGAKVAIEGLGKVGTTVLKLFSDAGAKIVGVSTVKGCVYNPDGLDAARLIELKKEVGGEVVNLYSGAEIIPKEN
ncbi:MAG: hypothetical protein GY941_26105 [Planctomycetes bacterium]|nr:hypothetical protein [Planctomycetota bacterium]